MWQVCGPDDREGIFDKEVEDDGHKADKGENGNASNFLLVCCVQLFLSHFPWAIFFFNQIFLFRPLYVLDIIPKFINAAPKLCHVFSDGVVVLHSAGDVAGGFLNILCILYDTSVTESVKQG